MSDGRRPDRLADRAEADRLLDAAGSGTPTEAGWPPDPLADLLAAAAAPARPHELAGEQAAMAAFRAARAAPATSPARRRPGFTAGALAWGAGVLVTATAGVAFAAVTLEKPPAPPTPPTPPTSVSPAPATADPDESASAGGTSTDGPDGSATAEPSTSPSRPAGATDQRGRLVGLCRAYLAKKPAQREKALTAAGFQPLVEAAGGAGQVEAYCQGVVPAPSADATRAGNDNGQGDGNGKAKDQGDGNGKAKDQGDENGKAKDQGDGNGKGPAGSRENGNGEEDGNGEENGNGKGAAQPADPTGP